MPLKWMRLCSTYLRSTDSTMWNVFRKDSTLSVSLLLAVAENVRLRRPWGLTGEAVDSCAGGLMGAWEAGKALPPVSKPSLRIWKPVCATGLEPLRRSLGLLSITPKEEAPSVPKLLEKSLLTRPVLGLWYLQVNLSSVKGANFAAKAGNGPESAFPRQKGREGRNTAQKAESGASSGGGRKSRSVRAGWKLPGRRIGARWHVWGVSEARHAVIKGKHAEKWRPKAVQVS